MDRETLIRNYDIYIIIRVFMYLYACARKITRNSFKLDDDKYVNKMSRQSGTPRDPLFIHCIDRIHTNVKVYIYPS